MSDKQPHTITLSFCAELELADQLDAFQAEQIKKTGHLSRSAALRMILIKGLEVLEPNTSSLNYRRAKFIYEGARLAAEAAEAPIVPEPYDDRELPFREQFEKVIRKQMGAQRSSNAAALHQDWMDAYEKMGWVYGEVRDPEAKTHPDMVPYDELGHLERDKDAVFVALCEIARKWVHKPGAKCDDKQELEKRVAELEEELDGLYEKAAGASL